MGDWDYARVDPWLLDWTCRQFGSWDRLEVHHASPSRKYAADQSVHRKVLALASLWTRPRWSCWRGLLAFIRRYDTLRSLTLT
jgi:hypothetical protein